ncbi:MAG TPA: hypothetical protein VFO69_06365 [Allosphingosinicella sp.]|nr:hypothetical protein [Allosphingosinicella sp.]
MRRFFGLSVFAAAMTIAAPASAQPAEGRPFTANGELENCDCRYGDHNVRLEAGRRYRIAASSEAFDSMLRLYRAGSTEPLAQDDDSGGDRNPLIYYTPTETGDYLVRVVSFTPDGAGAYALDIQALEALPAPITRATGTEAMTWQVYDGALEATDPATEDMRFDDYALELEAGQSALIRVDSEAFDPVVRVYSAAQRGASEAAMDDDSGGGLNSFLIFAPDEPGSYIVRVTSYSTEGSGAYRLRIAR